MVDMSLLINGSTSTISQNITLGNIMDLPVPTREGYNFKGWCFESTVSNDIDLGSYYLTDGSFTASFWTYCDDYAYSSGTNAAKILSCTQGGGWSIYKTADGSKYRFHFYDGGGSSSNAKYADINTSDITPGYHYWCASFTGSGKKLNFYLDGVLKASTSTTNNTCYWGSPKKLLLGDELSNSGEGASEGFVGKIGNVVITSDSGYYEPSVTEFMTPGTKSTVYTLKAEWEKGRYWYIYNGSKWRKALPYIYNGSGWKKAMTYVYNGSTWK